MGGHSGTLCVKSLLNPASLGDTTLGQLRKLSLGRGTNPRSHRVTQGVRAGFRQEPLYPTWPCHSGSGDVFLEGDRSYPASSASTILRSRMEDSVTEWPTQIYPQKRGQVLEVSAYSLSPGQHRKRHALQKCNQGHGLPL